MIELLKKDIHVGDNATLHLITGQTVKGKVIEIGDIYILLDVNGVHRRYLEQIIGGWDIENKENHIKLINNLVSNRQYDEAFSYIEQLLDSTMEDPKVYSSLLLRRAQLYSSLNLYHEAITAYGELISFNEKNEPSANNLSHLYTELSRLHLLVGDKDAAYLCKQKALKLNPNNKFAKDISIQPSKKIKKIGANGTNSQDETKVLVVRHFSNKKLLDDDIENHVFIDSEIKTMNGLVTDNIVQRLLEATNGSDNISLYLDCLKAIKSLPAGSYNIQDYEDVVKAYLLLKCRSYYTSFSKIIVEADDINLVSLKQLSRIKDCACDYYIETLEYCIDDEKSLAEELFNECLKLQLTCIALTDCNSLELSKEVIKSENSIDYAIQSNHIKLLCSIVLTYSYFAIRCSNLWQNLLSTSSNLQTLLNNLRKLNVYDRIIEEYKTTKLNQFIDKTQNFVFQLALFESNWLKNYHKRLHKLINLEFNLLSLDTLEKNIKWLAKLKFERCLNSTDRQAINQIQQFLLKIKLYKQRDKDQREIILTVAIQELTNIIQEQSDTPTLLGRFVFLPLILSWLSKLKDLANKNKHERNDCFLSITFDPQHYEIVNGKRIIYITISNKSNLTSEGYRVAIWSKNDQSNAIVKSGDRDIAPNNQLSLRLEIPTDKWGIHETYEINYSICSRHLGKWSIDKSGGLTISNKRDVTFSKTDIKWRERGDVNDDMFKGRDDIVRALKDHYCSNERYYSYILYGLSRTGKSTILKHLKTAICGATIQVKGLVRRICPIFLDLAAIYGTSRDNESFWQRMSKTILNEALASFRVMGVSLNIDNQMGFDDFIQKLPMCGLYPLFMFDEFSYMRNIIDDDYINAAFLQYLRKTAVEDELASYIFAGTYDIKELIHDPKYNIAGAFVYLKEPSKPVFEISESSAKELIQAMDDKLVFTEPAIDEIHRLTGDVPFWIQKLCLNCAFYAVENNKPDIGANELDCVVRKLTGESFEVLDNTSIVTMSDSDFERTQILRSDPREIELVLTTIAHLMKRAVTRNGITFDEMRVLWDKYNFDSSSYNIKGAIDLLLERRTLSHIEVDDIHYYRFSLDLFRRWWMTQHSNIELELSSFKRIIK